MEISRATLKGTDTCDWCEREIKNEKYVSIKREDADWGLDNLFMMFHPNCAYMVGEEIQKKGDQSSSINQNI